MGWFSDLIKDRKESNQKAFEDSFTNLSGQNDKEAASNRENFIAAQLTKYFGATPFDLPNCLKNLQEKISYTIKTLGVFVRKIELTGSWYLDNRDPLLVFTKNGHTPILLIPKGERSFYYVSYVTGKKVKGTVSLAKKLDHTAFAFYKPLPTHKVTIKEFSKYLRKSVRITDLILVTLMSVVVTAIAMLLPYLLKRFTGEVVENKDYQLYAVMAAYVISAGVGYILIKATQAFMNARVAIKIEKTMQEVTMLRMLSLPSSFYKKYSTGNLVSRFNSVSSLSSILFNGVFLTFLSSIMSLAFIVQIIQFTPSLILPVILILVSNVAFLIVVSLIQIRVSRKQLQLSAKESGTSYSIISGIQKIRLAGAEKRAFAKWAKDYARSSAPLYHPPLIIRLSTVISLAISLIGTIAIYFIASKNGINVSSFVAFSSSFGALSAAATASIEVAAALSRIRPVMEMARPILETELEDGEDKEEIEVLKGDIKIENVSFRYENDGRRILDNINIDIKEGEYLGIVGQTGCGKSTLVRLLLGFEKPTEGHIYFDNKNMETLNLQSLRSKIGSVTQNGGVFHADIQSNILITAPELSEKEAWEAARIAGIADDIQAMPMRMRTVISEGQGGISGGQKQRIMIARAIVNKPKILIFDEATSALDNKTQKSISESISQLNCTRIVIAHRLSTIKDCDRILYMEGGKITESGTYKELIALNGKFAELVERQRLDE